MSFGQLSYFVYMAIFCWIPIALIWARHRNILRKYKHPIRNLIILTLPIYLLWDNLSVYFRAWTYSPEKAVGIYLFFSPIESLIFTLSVDLAVAFITIIMYEQYKKNRNITFLKLFYYIILRK
ncbi:MAG: lycopene cyclase domain-containing protein [Candidatus Aenigmarchaeota archaeon]|nr:lycopene cyclase domain-containing protein [Candidatus Aenigmarchaeota archaeon]